MQDEAAWVSTSVCTDAGTERGVEEEQTAALERLQLQTVEVPVECCLLKRVTPCMRPARALANGASMATTVGAPLADTLRGFSRALRDAEEAADDVRVALAEPTSTARLMAWLPLVGVALAAAFGFDTFSALTRSPVGVACLVGGLLLTLAAHRWNAVLVRRASGAPEIPGMTAELLAIALSGGVSVPRARDLVDGALAGRDRSQDDTADEALALSRRAGVPAVEMLRASAALARHRARVDGRLRAARLSARLLIPLGVCTLPAFLLLGVAPMMLGVLGAVPLEVAPPAPTSPSLP